MHITLLGVLLTEQTHVLALPDSNGVAVRQSISPSQCRDVTNCQYLCSGQYSVVTVTSGSQTGWLKFNPTTVSGCTCDIGYASNPSTTLSFDILFQGVSDVDAVLTVSHDTFHVSTPSGAGFDCTSVYTVASGSILGITSGGNVPSGGSSPSDGEVTRDSISPSLCSSDPSNCDYVCSKSYTVKSNAASGKISFRPTDVSGSYCTCSVGTATEPKSNTDTFSIDFDDGETAQATASGQHIHVTFSLGPGVTCYGVYSVSSGSVLGIQPESSSSSSGVSSGAIAGVTIGLIVLVGIIVVIVIRQRQAKSKMISFQNVLAERGDS